MKIEVTVTVDLRNRFEKCHAQVKQGLSLAKSALMEIKEGELWRGGGFYSWKEYCAFINITEKGAWNLLEAEKVQRELPDVQIPNQATALELRKVAMTQRRQVVSDALEQSGGKLSPAAVKSAANSLAEPKKSIKLPKDATGIDIPPEIQEFWNRNEEIDHLLQGVKRARIAVEKAIESGDKLFNGIDRQGVVIKLRGTEDELNCAKSYAVCPSCNGIFFKDCPTCKGRGSLSKFWWDLQPEEVKALRES